MNIRYFTVIVVVLTGLFVIGCGGDDPVPISSDVEPTPVVVLSPTSLTSSLTQVVHESQPDVQNQTSSGPELRNDVAERQVELGGANVTAALCDMLQNEAEIPRWRNYCVQRLADMAIRHGDEEALSAVREATLSDVPLVEAEAACFSLARIAAEGHTSDAEVDVEVTATLR